MAIDTLLHVLNNSKAKKSHRLVLIEIANHTNKDGLAWPSYQRLASITGLSRRWVIQIISDLQAVGELEIIPNGSPAGGQAYRILTGELTSPGMKSRGEVSSVEVVNSLHPNLYIESLYCKNNSNEEEAWLTPEVAVKFGLTPGSRMYRRATGELLPEG
jgi:helix-turn-helix protein